MFPQAQTEMLVHEVESIRRRRQLVFPQTAAADLEDAARNEGRQPPDSEHYVSAAALQHETVLEEQFGALHKLRPFGVALSGGGIRSATLNLGILQGLADQGMIKYVDYLSTVSGGGYIGSWLHGLIRNHPHCQGDVRQAEAILSPSANPVPDSPEKDPLTFLRKYSNYLAPRPGLFSADTWVIGSIWLRNVLLNQLILVPTLCAVILIALLSGFVQQYPSPAASAGLGLWLGRLLVIASLTPLAAGVLLSAASLRQIVARLSTAEPGVGDAATTSKFWVRVKWLNDQLDRLSARVERHGEWVPALVFFTAVPLACSNVEQWGVVDGSVASRWVITFVLVGLFGVFAVFQLTGGFVEWYDRMHPRTGDARAHFRVRALFHVAWMVFVAASVSTALIWATWRTLLVTSELASSWHRLAFGPPLVSLSILAGGGLLVGLMGADYPDAAREWLARGGALLSLLCAGWAGFFVVAVFGPWWMARLLDRYALVGVTAISGWMATTAAGVLAGRSGNVNGKGGGVGASALSLVASAAPAVFMIGYLLVLATAMHVAVARATGSPLGPGTWAPTTTPTVYDVALRTEQGTQSVQVNLKTTQVPSWLGPALAPIVGFEVTYWQVLHKPATSLWLIGIVVLLFAVFGLVAAVASARININEFSLHHFYKNRLVRCFLGASNTQDRHPNPFTGFDPSDDFVLGDLQPTKEPPPARPLPANPPAKPSSAQTPSAQAPSTARQYRGPYAIVNTALNLNAGSELAQQERKAASFVFTPGYCGFLPAGSKADLREWARSGEEAFTKSGYCRTQGYSSPKGPYLGTAMAISGAAANPNAGYQTSGPLAFLLTVFDARLGWWLGNPRRPKVRARTGPRFAWFYLFRELLGQTTGRSHYVNLSDGGHFDNLGLYELVRRRCRYIIVGDGEQDGDLTFGALGGAIRKCRADFGVEIDLDPRPLRLKNGLSTAHCVVGTIRYPERETASWTGMSEGALVPVEGDDLPDNARGWLLYLKSSLTGDEPGDVSEYRSKNPEFPHQSTADQFFSESQFESYRRLGLHIVRDAFEGVPDLRDHRGLPADLALTFQRLTQKWYAPIPAAPGVATRLAESYSSIVRLMGTNKVRDLLVQELLPPPNPQAAKPGLLEISPEVLLFGVEAVQLIENVFTEFNLEFEANRANPRIAGWMKVFRRWARSSVVKDQVWPQVRNDYNPLFRTFMDVQLLEDPDHWPNRP